jgi:hypothetical protein
MPLRLILHLWLNDEQMYTKLFFQPKVKNQSTSSGICLPLIKDDSSEDAHEYGELYSAKFMEEIYSQLPQKDPFNEVPKLLVIGAGSDKSVIGSIKQLLFF